jgi:hypothetical protein
MSESSVAPESREPARPTLPRRLVGRVAAMFARRTEAMPVERDVVPEEPPMTRELVFVKFFEAVGVRPMSLEECEARAVEFARAGHRVGRTDEIAGSRGSTKIARNYGSPALAFCDGHLAALENDCRNAESECAASRDDVEVGGWATQDALGRAQALVDRTRQRLADAKKLWPVVERLDVERRRVAALRALGELPPRKEPAPWEVPHVRERPSNIAPFVDDGLDFARATERRWIENQRANLSRATNEDAGVFGELARLECEAKAWDRENPHIARALFGEGSR